MNHVDGDSIIYMSHCYGAMFVCVLVQCDWIIDDCEMHFCCWHMCDSCQLRIDALLLQLQVCNDVSDVVSDVVVSDIVSVHTNGTISIRCNPHVVECLSI